MIWSASLADGYYRLWLYDVDSSDYQLREIIAISEFDLAPRNPRKLANKKYSNLRLCADTTHNKQMPTDR